MMLSTGLAGKLEGRLSFTTLKELSCKHRNRKRLVPLSIADKFNGATFFAFMKSLRRTSIRAGRRVVVITDNAKYHHARLHKPWREEHAADFMLDYLPPYSPELNPIERVWKLTRRRCLHNRYFPHLNDVIAAVEAEFAQWGGRNDTLRRLCAIT